MNRPSHEERDASGNADQQVGLIFEVAKARGQVEDAWSLVYSSYLRTGLIRPNHHKLHTVYEAVGPHTAVIFGHIGDVVASTMSAFLDNDRGLPMDKIYADELAGLRDRGRRLVEVGLFADRREQVFDDRSKLVNQDRRKQIGGSMFALLELMRHIWYFGYTQGADDMVIGVHPHHAAFYKRFFAFEQFADESVCPSVRDHPVVPLKMDIKGNMQLDPLPRGLRYFAENPMNGAFFQTRFAFDPADLAGSPIEAALHALRPAV